MKNESIIAEYVELSARHMVMAPEAERQHHARLDELWYAQMSLDDRVEAERRLLVLNKTCPGSRKHKRFFSVCDGGSRYVVVACDLVEAKQILHDVGIEFTTASGVSYPIGAPEVSDVEWRELSSQDSTTRHVWLGDGGVPPQSGLAICDLGDWFWSVI